MIELLANASFSRPACWAVSNTDLDPHAFGPETSGIYQSRSQPRWLNSGTILAPAKDLKDFFQATLAEIQANHTTDSDQYYMAEVYGRQEFARLQQNRDLLHQYKSVRYAEELEDLNAPITRSDAKIDGLRTEYHIGIDYKANMFQTLAYWKQFLTWIKPAESWPKSSDQQVFEASPNQVVLPDDIAQSLAPVGRLDHI